MTPPIEAFLFGLISACSLPLGAITAMIWHPRARVVAALMAFGSGALLAALTIDIVAVALSRGHFYPLAIGCIAGGLLFISLNQIINSHGGFLRKSSTTVWYFRRKAMQRFKRLLTLVRRLEMFSDITPSEAEQLSRLVVSREVNEGVTLYRAGDPSEYLYIIDRGELVLLDPQDQMRPFQQLGANDAFGRMAFLAGTPHATVAVTKADTRLWLLSREDLSEMVRESATLAATLERELASGEVARYLVERHDFKAQEAEQWVNHAIADLRHGKFPREAVSIENRRSQFLVSAERIHRLPLFRSLSTEELKKLSACIFLKHHAAGHTFFHQNETAERLYVIEHGSVALLDPLEPSRQPTLLHDCDAFGGMSFLTGAVHSVTAVAHEETSVWVLRKQDFDDLVASLPGLAMAIQKFLEQQETAEYLTAKHGFAKEKATRWVRQAIDSMNSGRHMIPAAEMARTLMEHKGAPLAIWLGIMLDGIPESLVIGSSMVQSHVSVSLLAGLCISNYPEALSSSAGMRLQGFGAARILVMWTSLMLITGVGAAVGNLFFREAPPFMFAIVEGTAAGSMLTMIAETMLPEAYFKGGSIVGFATLLGFLTAIFFKVLDPSFA